MQAFGAHRRIGLASRNAAPMTETVRATSAKGCRVTAQRRSRTSHQRKARSVEAQLERRIILPPFRGLFITDVRSAEPRCNPAGGRFPSLYRWHYRRRHTIPIIRLRLRCRPCPRARRRSCSRPPLHPLHGRLPRHLHRAGRRSCRRRPCSTCHNRSAYRRRRLSGRIPAARRSPPPLVGRNRPACDRLHRL